MPPLESNIVPERGPRSRLLGIYEKPGTEGKIQDERSIEKAKEIADVMEREIPAVFVQLENQFRQLLGSKTDP